MKSEKKYTIGILMGDTHTEYSTELIKGFHSCAMTENVNLIFLMRSSLPQHSDNILAGTIGDDYQIHFSSIYDYIPLIKPDALIIAYGSLSVFSDTPRKEQLLQYLDSIPCLMLEDTSERSDIPSLVADNYVGMCQCIRHLIVDHGYRKIAFLSGPENNRDSAERLQAYRDTMQQYNLPVTDTMVAYGNYTELVTDKVEYLLDNNPWLEAIAFANDNMAKAGYAVCDKRGIMVGRDLAITGFDDVDIAKTMNPPLTSITHSSFLFSYQALQNAIRLCQGKETVYQVIPANLHIRNSCGCISEVPEHLIQFNSKVTLDGYISDYIQQIISDCFFSIPYVHAKKQYSDLLERFFHYILDCVYEYPSMMPSNNQLAAYLKPICEYPNISTRYILEQIIQLLRRLGQHTTNTEMRFIFLQLISFTQEYVHSFEVLALQNTLHQKEHQNWFVNTFTQDLIASRRSLTECLECIMKRLQLIQVKSAYFFLYPTATIQDKKQLYTMPANLHLAAYYNEHEMRSFCHENWLPINDSNRVLDFLPDKSNHFYTSFVLFSDEMQYGLLLCECNPEQIPHLLTCSIQIGTFLNLYQVNEREHKIKEELQASLIVIQEKNNILNFLSEYDELTQLLNRRGFIEQTLRTVTENCGKNAYLLFADLDHLKEINDCFGHAAGDHAIQTAANYLRNCLPCNSILARIGGDEFAAIVLSDDTEFQENTMQTIKEHANAFNTASDQPYYIELSLGIYKCLCNPDVPVTALLKKADALLYAQKLHRRESIKK